MDVCRVSHGTHLGVIVEKGKGEVTQQNPPTTVGQLSATGTGEVRDKDGHLLDGEGNLVETQPDSGEDN